MASTALEEKINKIRQRNEEIRRRHEEVEADKQNAAKLNALVKMVPPTDWPERKEPPEFSNPPAPRSNGNYKPKSSAREHRVQQQQYHAAGGDGKKTHVFAEGDGPPPDPSYNFLADAEREERARDDLRDDRFRGRGGSQRGTSKRRGGDPQGHSKDYRGSASGTKDATRPEYEAWRAERNRIDEARISRQRTAEGNWRREWDNNKVNVAENETGAPKSVRLNIGETVRKDHKEFDKWQSNGNDHDSPRGRGGKQHVSRGAPRGSPINRVYQHSNSFEQYHGHTSPSANKSASLSPNGIDERTVVATDKSIKVIVNHETTTSKSPVMSVKVSSSSIAGTGRVGPRQKPRILYSSQSENEASSHEHDKFFNHKSPDDKTSHVYFNRDNDEQQRSVPKSPHPHRKTDGNSKSPYLPRKEFKYDAQQQRHGENESKSPYTQRKQVKDSPKSPHFEKKADFSNRDSHIRQKNKSSGASTHSQKRTFDKTKHDSQKYTTPKKFEEPYTPKPQRTHKRNDKSKSLHHGNCREGQEPNTNESNTQSDNLNNDKSERSTNNQIVNNSENYNETNNVNDICEKQSSEDTALVNAVNETENGDKFASKPIIDSVNASPSTGVIGIEKSDTDKICSIDTCDITDKSEPMIILNYENTNSEELCNKNAEKESEIDSMIPNSDEDKTGEHCDIVEQIETSNELPKVLDESQKKPDIQTITEINIVDSTLETNCTVENISDNEIKCEQLNSIPAKGLDNVKEPEENVLTLTNELQSEAKAEIFQKPKDIAEELLQASNAIETSDVEKEALSSLEIKVQDNEEIASSNVDSQVAKNPEDKETSVI
ncbi:dentin sialophosphoprotein-like [Neodiprion virginianus]|uniref:dentin sialophosphoprotein-like n=1 Tax=Neodiprion virginianus TaxID=2961670 RepID=UPI001EE740BA|nr:dentin sialophosphoprotein-like [Neodiprion virginianus]